MYVIVGSKNPAKVDAVKELLSTYAMFSEATFSGMNADSGISDQPMSLDETIEGAKNRARNVFKECDYSVGLESGLIAVPETKTGFMDITICAMYDGTNFHLGTSSAFEYPIEMTKRVLAGKGEISDIAKDLGLTTHPKVGEAEGMIGILTKGRVNRKTLTQQAIITAMIHLENPEAY